MPILGLRLSGLQAKNIAAQMAKEAGSISAAARLSQGELFNIPRRTFSDLVNPLKPLPSARTIQRLTSQLEKGYFPTNQQRFERTVQHTSYFSEYSQLDDIMVPPDSDAFRIISMSGEETQNEYFWIFYLGRKYRGYSGSVCGAGWYRTFTNTARYFQCIRAPDFINERARIKPTAPEKNIH